MNEKMFFDTLCAMGFEVEEMNKQITRMVYRSGSIGCGKILVVRWHSNTKEPIQYWIHKWGLNYNATTDTETEYNDKNFGSEKSFKLTLKTIVAAY